MGRDGRGYIADLGQARTEIFLQMGLDRLEPTNEVICPSGKISRRRFECLRQACLSAWYNSLTKLGFQEGIHLREIHRGTAPVGCHRMLVVLKRVVVIPV